LYMGLVGLGSGRTELDSCHGDDIKNDLVTVMGTQGPRLYDVRVIPQGNSMNEST